VQGKVLSARGLRRGLLVTALVLGVVLLAGPSAADHGPESHALTISDPSAVVEGDSGTVSVSFDVTLSLATVTEPVSVDFATANNTAHAPGDYTSVATTTLTFPPATLDLTQSVTVQVQGDSIDEVDETFFGNLSNVSANASIADGQGIATISDDDSTPTVSIGDAPAVTEGGTASFPVTLSAASGQLVTVNYGTTHGTTSAADFTGSLSGSVTFLPGDTTESIDLSTVNDSLDEVDPETFTVTLATPSNATIGDGSGSGAINDNDSMPALSISNVTQAEGNSGITTFVFTVSLTPASGRTVTVNFATRNGTAIADGIGSANDYAATSGSRTFNAGDTSETISVAVNGDTFNEGAENFFVDLSGATNASLPATPFGTGTISNDDVQPSLSVEDKTVNEGVGTASFTVTLAPSSGQTVQVNYAINDGSATSPADYGDSSNLLSFAAGETTKTIFVSIVQDTLDEADTETFTISLSNESNAVVSPAERDSTEGIVDDDPAPSVSIASAPAITEGGVASFPVTLSAASGRSVSVQYTTSNGTAAAPGDFASATNATLTFAPGETSKPIQIQTNDDLLDEPDTENFTVTISAPTNATLGTPTSGTGTINDNDALPTLSVSDANALEGSTGGLPACGAPPAPGTNPTGFTSFTVSLSPASGRTVNVQWSTANGTAVAPDDYASVAPTTLTFAPGSALSQTVCVRINGDVSDEANETFNVVLTGPTNATLADGTGVGTILDDDGAPALTVTGASDPEGGGPARFVVSLLPASGNTVTVSVGTAGGTAVSGTDFAAIPSAVFPSPPTACSANPCGLTFTPGQTSKAIDITLVDDSLDENDETFTVSLSNEVNATILNGDDRFGIVTIVDDDGPPSVSISDATVTEGDAGTVNASFQVTLSTPSGRAISINYAAANASAAAPEDYAASGGTLSFAPGETSKTIVVPVNGDTSVEGDETFTVGLSGPVSVTIADGHAVGTIVNDDASPPPPPPPPLSPEPPPPTSTTTTGPTTSTTTTAGPPPPPPPPPTFGGMKISAAPVTLFDDLAPIGVTCSRQATGTCTGTVVVRGQVRLLAIVHGKPSARAVTFGRESFAIPRGRTEKVLVSLNRRALKAVKRAGRLKVTVVVTARDSARKRAKQVSRALWLRTAKAPAPKKAKTSAARR
jgi:large repetitive protein